MSTYPISQEGVIALAWFESKKPSFNFKGWSGAIFASKSKKKIKDKIKLLEEKNRKNIYVVHQIMTTHKEKGKNPKDVSQIYIITKKGTTALIETSMTRETSIPLQIRKMGDLTGAEVFKEKFSYKMKNESLKVFFSANAKGDVVLTSIERQKYAIYWTRYFNINDQISKSEIRVVPDMENPVKYIERQKEKKVKIIKRYETNRKRIISWSAEKRLDGTITDPTLIASQDYYYNDNTIDEFKKWKSTRPDGTTPSPGGTDICTVYYCYPGPVAS